MIHVIFLLVSFRCFSLTGYYANNFPSLSDVKSNSTTTVRVKNEHRGLHLNNLSYVGPIIMGVGGKFCCFFFASALKNGKMFEA